MNITCPNCGASHYIEHFSHCTAVYYPPVYKDGVNTNPDGNVTTTYCTCYECNHNFKVEFQYGEIVNSIDCGPASIPPTSDVPINGTTVENSDKYTPVETKVATATIDIKTGEHLRTKYQWELDIEELQKEVKELKEEVHKLKVKNMLF